jgi:hypothetical protein
MKTLIVLGLAATLASSTLTRVASASPEPKKCQSVINSLVKEVESTSGGLIVKRVNLRTETKIWSNPPQGQIFDLDMGGNQKIPWYRDASKMQNITTKMVKSCPGIVGTVITIEGDYLNVYGLVNRKVRKFSCPQSKQSPFRWGYYSGECGK